MKLYNIDMVMMKDIEVFKLDAEHARLIYLDSDGKEWLKYILVLKMLYLAYCSNRMFENAKECKNKLSAVLRLTQNKIPIHIPVGNNPVADSIAIEDIMYWAEKEEEYRKELPNGGSIQKYSKFIIALCEYLRLAGESKLALMKYEEVLSILMENDNDTNEEGGLYLKMVIMLKIAECSHELGNESLSRYYSIYPLLFYSQLASKGHNNLDTMNWDYISELCKSIVG